MKIAITLVLSLIFAAIVVPQVAATDRQFELADHRSELKDYINAFYEGPYHMKAALKWACEHPRTKADIESVTYKHKTGPFLKLHRSTCTIEYENGKVHKAWDVVYWAGKNHYSVISPTGSYWNSWFDCWHTRFPLWVHP